MTVTHFWNSWNGDARRSLIVAGGLCVALAMATFLGSGGLAATAAATADLSTNVQAAGLTAPVRPATQ